MVQDTRKTAPADAFKPVNLPERIRLAAYPHGKPLALAGRPVIAVEDRWRIDDEWWRSRPVARLYWAVILASGQRMVVYQDLVDNCWYRQSY